MPVVAGIQRCLGVDIGNSGLRVTELDLASRDLGETVRINWSFAEHVNSCSADGKSRHERFQPNQRDWLDLIKSFLCDEPTAWMVSSVRRDALKVLEEAIAACKRHTLHVVDFRDVPLRIRVDWPEKVGTDRLLAALAASQLTKTRPLIVVEAGSAVTVDLVCSGKVVNSEAVDSFEGGAILPGIPMMLRLLGTAAEQLPRIEGIELSRLPPLPGKNTEQAMILGATNALLGGVRQLVERYRSEWGQSVPVVLGGGDGYHLMPHLPDPVIVESQLVQQGLLILAGRLIV